MKIDIEITEKDLTKMVMDYITNKINIDVKENDVQIMVKSKQNYKSEWEEASFKAVYKKSTL